MIVGRAVPLLAPPVLAFTLAARILLADPAPLVAPQEPGSSLGEPTAAFEGLVLRAESLRLDLRPLGEGRDHVVVEATYRIANDGASRALVLQVPTAGARLVSDVQGGMWLDEMPVPLVPAKATALPADWLVPATTPGLAGAPPLSIAQSAWRQDLMAGSLELPAGEHVLRLRYAARAAPDHSRTPALWQLAYVLAPARRFASFRLLEIEVLLPAGWQAATDPPLARAAASLRGTFAVVPADALALTAQGPLTQTAAAPLPPEGPRDPRRRALKIALAVLLLPGTFLILAFVALRWLTTRGERGRPSE